MSLTVDLRSPVGDDLSREAERVHASPSEHAQILLSLIWSLRREHQDATSARMIREYLRARSLDPDQFVTAFDDLVNLLLKNRCNPSSIDENIGVGVIDLPPLEDMAQKLGRTRRVSGRGAAAHLKVSSEDVMREHREEVEKEEKGWS
jgi:hypothetical protein